MTVPNEPRPSIVVIGGGPAGAATAIGLARLDVPVLLIERSDGTGNPIGETLAPSATPLLYRLGLYDAFLTSQPLPSYANRSSWGGDGTLAEHDFLREPYGPGWHLDRPTFNAALLSAAVDAGAACWLHTGFQRAERASGGRWRVHVATAGAERRSVDADFVVDASGRRAVFARQQGARRRALDRLVAAVAMLAPAAGPMRDASTFVEASEDGWWYSALLPDGRLATAYFSDPDLLAARQPWLPSGWHALMQTGPFTQARIASHGYNPSAQVQVTAAGSVLLTPTGGEGWIAAGDAVAAYDPLSSHGIGSALAAGQRAAMAAAAYLGGQRQALADYAERSAESYAAYVALWRSSYAAVRRWPTAPFWRRRVS